MRTTPEARFIIACTREPNGAATNALRAAADAVLDWTSVAELASSHGVAALVRQSIAAAGIGIPPQTDAALRTAAVSALAHVMSLNLHLERVARAFAVQAVPLMVLKGPALARTVYSAIGLRPYGDIDLNVRKGDEERAAAELAGSGFVEIPYHPEIERLAHAGHGAEEGFHRLFVSEPERLLFELHVDPLQLGISPVCEDERWQRAVPLPGLAGALMLGPEDQVVHLSVHAHKHGFSRLIWLKDLELLLRKEAGRLDWEVVARVARLEGVRSSVWYSLRVASELLNFPMPPQAERMRPSPPLRLLYGFVWPRDRVANLSGHGRWRAVQFRVADSWRGMLPTLVLMGRRRDRARALARAILHR